LFYVVKLYTVSSFVSTVELYKNHLRLKLWLLLVIHVLVVSILIKSTW